MKKRIAINRALIRDVVDYFCCLRQQVPVIADGNRKMRMDGSHKKRLSWRLNELSASEAEAQNVSSRAMYADWLNLWHARNGEDATPKRNPYPAKKALHYDDIDFHLILDAADKLFSIYLDGGDEWGAIVRDRYIVSVARALEILHSPEAHKYGCVELTSGFVWAYDPVKRSHLRARLNAEKEYFEKKGEWPEDVESLKRTLSERQSFTISDCLSGNARALVMLAVLARLMVSCAVHDADLWRRDTLFKVYEHMLSASMRSYDLSFPFHLDIASDYLRLGRTHDRQNNMVSDYIDAKYYDSSEKTLFGGFVAYYLLSQVDCKNIWTAIRSNEQMKKFFVEAQIHEITSAVNQVCTATKPISCER